MNSLLRGQGRLWARPKTEYRDCKEWLLTKLRHPFILLNKLPPFYFHRSQLPSKKLPQLAGGDLYSEPKAKVLMCSHFS